MDGGWEIVVVSPRARACRCIAVPRWGPATVLTSLLLLPASGLAAGWELRVLQTSAVSGSAGAQPIATAGRSAPGAAAAPRAVEETRTSVAQGATHEPEAAPATDSVEAARSRLLGARERATSRAERLGLGTPEAARELMAGEPDPSWVAAAGAPGQTPGTLRWPVDEGWFTHGFGSGAGGEHRGIDIMAERGAPVRAAASGMVGYAGDGVPGYGNLVVLVHGGGWVTAYGHNAENLVTAGQTVERGHVIARLGSTGVSRSPHLHLEMRFEGQSCDSSHLFRPGIRHRGGRMTPLDYVAWEVPSHRPRVVRCEEPRGRGRRGRRARGRGDEPPRPAVVD